MRSRVGIALVLVLLTSACAGWLRIPRLTGWHAAEIGGVRLIGDLPADEVQGLAGDLARFDAIFTWLAGSPEGGNATPLEIYLIRNPEIGQRFGLGRGAAAGWALEALDVSCIAVEMSWGRDAERSTLFHEYTHFLLARNQRAPVPRWYNEGLATYFSTLSERSGAVVVGAAPGLVAGRLKRRGAMPFDRLFTNSVVDMSYDEVADFYATSWALSHYLLSSPSGRRDLSEFVKQLARGVPSEQAQAAAFGRSVDRLGQELASYIGYLTRGVPIETVIDASTFASPDPPQAVALQPGEVAYALGSLALDLVEVDEQEDWHEGPDLARNFLALAVAQGAPDAPRVEAALGEAMAVSGDAEGAQAAVQSALAQAPGDLRVRMHAARVALLRAEAEAPSGSPLALADAEEQYRHVLALDPESASAWFGLGRTMVESGRPDAGFAAFATARRFGWSRPLDIALARIHLERGERERAAELLRPVAQDPHGGAAQEEAAALLKQTVP